jgi:hypothetical protein
VVGLAASSAGRLLAASSDGTLVAWEAVREDDDGGGGNGTAAAAWRPLPCGAQAARLRCAGALACDAAGAVALCGGAEGVWLTQVGASSSSSEPAAGWLRVASGGCGTGGLAWALGGARLLLCGDGGPAGALRLQDAALGRPALELRPAAESPCLAAATTAEPSHEGAAARLWAAAAYADGTASEKALLRRRFLCELHLAMCILPSLKVSLPSLLFSWVFRCAYSTSFQ